ncbi:regulatory signaling modulator protein AmpE [Flagellatimonas centrodinii]|uniref:regulatory signaling modulator protein AmpE n=1 Tax=Flagellatimonas centrodinii TaxID=2806210 RepID=UPI001FEE1346|nr:regulatory signaling modulator protein AmpE [Flagellatimonas centrodinii]ULQ45220.1 regulatory signaling modulator protein AmpE [Flagellatimonas centrodinii]
MTLIGVLAAILFERVLGQLPGWGDARVLPWAMRNAARWLPWPKLWSHPLVLLLWGLLPVWAVWELLEGIPHPLLQVLLSAGVLLLCLGPRDLAEDIHRLQAAHEAGDSATAHRLTQQLRLGAPQPDPSHRSLLGSLFIQSHERLFGVLLAFLAFGAAGALAYRLASRLPMHLLEHQGESPAQRWADRIHQVFAYLPARLTALLFGLAGSLDDALSAWRRLGDEQRSWDQRTWIVLSEVAAASVMREEADGAPAVPGKLDDCLDEVLRMQWRALLILLAVFAVGTTGSLL